MALEEVNKNSGRINSSRSPIFFLFAGKRKMLKMKKVNFIGSVLDLRRLIILQNLESIDYKVELVGPSQREWRHLSL